MRLYLDDNTVGQPLVGLLRKADHTVTLPQDVGLEGASDPRHFACAIVSGLSVLTYDHRDFLELHHLIGASGGNHPGLLIIRRDNDSTRDMTPRGIVTAINKLQASGVALANEVYVLNHWR